MKKQKITKQKQSFGFIRGIEKFSDDSLQKFHQNIYWNFSKNKQITVSFFFFKILCQKSKYEKWENKKNHLVLSEELKSLIYWRKLHQNIYSNLSKNKQITVFFCFLNFVWKLQT